MLTSFEAGVSRHLGSPWYPFVDVSPNRKSRDTSENMEQPCRQFG